MFGTIPEATIIDWTDNADHYYTYEDFVTLLDQITGIARHIGGGQLGGGPSDYQIKYTKDMAEARKAEAEQKKQNLERPYYQKLEVLNAERDGLERIAPSEATVASSQGGESLPRCP